MKIVVFDTETTGFYSPSLSLADQPAVVQFGAIQIDCDLAARKLREIQRIDQLINPGKSIPPEATRVHHITDAMVADAPPFSAFVDQMVGLFRESHVVVGHNFSFDKNIVEVELERLGRAKNMWPAQVFDTMTSSVDVCKLPGKNGYKYPTLAELHRHFFSEEFDGAHNAMVDVLATARCMKQLLSLGIFQPREPAQATLF